MKIQISKKLIQSFPEQRYLIGIVKNTKVIDANSYTKNILTQSYPLIKQKYEDKDLLGHDNTIAYFNQAKLLPGKRFSYPHNQIKRVLAGNEISNVNNIVNLYMNYELLHNLSFSAYDLDEIIGDLKVKILNKKTKMKMLNGNQTYVEPGDIVFRDKEGIIYSYMRGYSHRTKISSNTNNIMYLIDCPEGIETSAAREAMRKLLSNFQNSKQHLLNRDLNSVKI